MYMPEMEDRGMEDPKDPHDELPPEKRTPEHEAAMRIRRRNKIKYEQEDDMGHD